MYDTPHLRGLSKEDNLFKLSWFLLTLNHWEQVAQEIANAVHDQELLSMVIYHPMWNVLVTLDQFL